MSNYKWKIFQKLIDFLHRFALKVLTYAIELSLEAYFLFRYPILLKIEKHLKFNWNNKKN